MEKRLPELRHFSLCSSAMLLLEKTIIHGEFDFFINEKQNNSATEFIPLCNNLFQDPLQTTGSFRLAGSREWLVTH